MLFSHKYANAYFDYLKKDLKHILTKLCVCMRVCTPALECMLRMTASPMFPCFCRFLTSPLIDWVQMDHGYDGNGQFFPYIDALEFSC